MNPSEMDPRERILLAAVELLQDDRHAGQVTVRQIAARAGVGGGLINYHFQNKQNLLNMAFGRILQEQVQAVPDLRQAFGRILQKQVQPGLDPRQANAPPLARLKLLAHQAGKIALAQPGLARIGIEYALLQGRFETAQLILPILRDHFGSRKTELELRALALALLSALLVAFLRLDEVTAFMGYDPRDPSDLAALSDLVIDQILGEEERKLKWKT
jgi:AcrR family transcriptional regulator